MTNVGDCRDAHGASKERLRVGGFEGIDHAASQRGTLSRNEFLPLETLVTREGRTGGTCCGSDILVLKHESRKITYFWVVLKFKVLVFRSNWFGLLPAAA